MGIKIRYLAPAAAGTAFTYAVQRRADNAFFDFARRVFLPRGDITPPAASRQLKRHGKTLTATFAHAKPGEKYIIHIQEAGPGSMIIAALPVTAGRGEGGQHMEPSYRAGKKFVEGRAVEAKARLTFYGNDGFTIHTATLWADGTSSCNCPRWVKKTGPERGCPHSERALTLASNVDETGTQPEPPPPVEPEATSPFKRRSRSVDT